jgi:hypothetical protein
LSWPGDVLFWEKDHAGFDPVGGVLLAVFCFYFIPYQLMASSRYMHFGEWENAAKELALASGALVIAGLFLQS